MDPFKGGRPLATDFQQRVNRNGHDERHARVAAASGAMPYLKQSARRELFSAYLDRLEQIGTDWSAHDRHGDVLRQFNELGGFSNCPNPPRKEILKWMVKTYIGTRGGRTSYGNIRHVFYSNSAAPLIKDIIRADPGIIADELKDLRAEEKISARCENEHIARRFEQLLDLLE